MECVMFHLLTVFRNDAAKAQMYYISNGLKKPNLVPVRQFVQRIQQVNKPEAIGLSLPEQSSNPGNQESRAH